MRKQKLSWDDISIRQYIEIMKVLSDESRQSEIKALDIIPIIWPEIDPETIPMTEAINYISETNNLLQQPLNGSKSKLPKSFDFPNFGKCKITEIDRMTLAQFMDFQNISALSSDEHLGELLSVCIVPVNNKYNSGYDIVELQNMIEELPITMVPAILDFFVQRSKKLLNRLRISLGTTIMMSKELTWKEKYKTFKSLVSMMDLLLSQ